MSTPLLQKNTRFLLLWLPLVMVGCSLIFYYVLRGHAHHMQEKQLELKQSNVWRAFTTRPESFPLQILGEYDLTEHAAVSHNPQPRDTQLYFVDKNQGLPFQVLSVPYFWKGRPYILSTYVSSREISHLIIKVFVTEAIIWVLLLVTIVIVNKRAAQTLWSPFFSSIRQLKEYDISRNPTLDLPPQTGTREFDQLNQVIGSLIGNVNQAYLQQKQFVENASHEMQTPLAIIRSKLELLINQPGLDEKKAVLLGDITEANDRLSQMNRTLLLLAKIENNQFPDVVLVNVSELLCGMLRNYQEHYESFPELTSHIEDGIQVRANRSLVEILLSNLLKNAIEHNVKDGSLKITLQPSRFIIENTGLPPQVPTAQLFDRFRKGAYGSPSTGLGLALVRQICLLYGYTIHYKYEGGWHQVEVGFTQVDSPNFS